MSRLHTVLGDARNLIPGQRRKAFDLRHSAIELYTPPAACPVELSVTCLTGHLRDLKDWVESRRARSRAGAPSMESTVYAQDRG